MNESEDIDLDEVVEGGPDDANELDEDSIDGEFAEDDESSDSSGSAEEDSDDDDEESRPRARKVDDDADDDDEEEEDVEADLEQILRGRMATDDDDEDEADAVADEGAKPGAVNARKSDEFVCGICFMVVAQKQTELPCPMGDGLEPHQPLDM